MTRTQQGVINTKKLFPSRDSGKQLRGYQNIAWRPSHDIAKIINEDVRCDYVDNKLAPIATSSHVNVVVEEEEEEPAEAAVPVASAGEPAPSKANLDGFFKKT